MVNYQPPNIGDDNEGDNGSWLGNLLHGASAMLAGFLLFFLGWPMLIPFYGTGENFTRISPWNYILTIAWWMILILGFSFWRGYRGTPGDQETHQDNQPPS